VTGDIDVKHVRMKRPRISGWPWTHSLQYSWRVFRWLGSW